MLNKFAFFKVAIKNLKVSGTIIPSSQFLAKKLIKEIDFSKADVIIELGPGNGVITKKILKKMHPKSTLICFEINDSFYKELKSIKHPQLRVINKSAEKIEEVLNDLGYSKGCHIVSSLPLTNIPDEISQKILQNSFNCLDNKGTFIQYQYSLTYFNKIKTIFGKGVAVDFELLNLPPAFIYRCIKLN